MKCNYTKLNNIETPLFPVAERDAASRFQPQRTDIRVLKDDKTVKGTPISSSGVTSSLSPAAIRVDKVDVRQASGGSSMRVIQLNSQAISSALDVTEVL